LSLGKPSSLRSRPNGSFLLRCMGSWARDMPSGFCVRISMRDSWTHWRRESISSLRRLASLDFTSVTLFVTNSSSGFFYNDFLSEAATTLCLSTFMVHTSSVLW
jgi:hypothetical protein